MHLTGKALRHLLSLRGKLLFLVCLATLPAVLFTAYAAENERRASLARTESDALHMARLTSREHAHQIRGAQELLSWLGTKLARDGLASRIIADADFLPALLAGHPQLANIGVLSPTGDVLRSAYPLASTRSWKDNRAFAAALNSSGVQAGTYGISPILDRPTLNHALAVRNEAGRVTSVVFTGLNLDWLSAMARENGTQDGLSLLITDRDGRVLAFGADEAEQVHTGAVVPAVIELAREGRGRLVQMQDIGLRFVVATPLDGVPGLYVAVGLQYERVLNQANTAFYRTLAALGLLTVMTILAAFLAAEVGFLRGLRSLARTAQRFGAGDLAARAGVPRGSDEPALLAMAFNAMAESLEHRHQEALDVQTALRGLAQALQQARETEAARISRELHDQLGQVLTSLKIDLARLSSHCPAEDRDRTCARALRQGIAAMNEQIVAAVDAVRRLSSELRPGVLDQLGLIPAMEWQAREVENRTDLAVQVEADGVPPDLDETVGVTLFRIVQEALTNVIRHAEARVVEIRLRADAGTLTLEIHDDGRGIEMAAIRNPLSLGLAGMRERVRLIAGQFSIRGTPNRGTILTVTVPLAGGGTDAHPAG